MRGRSGEAGRGTGLAMYLALAPARSTPFGPSPQEGNIEADFAYLTDESRSARRAHCSSEGRGSCETTPGDPVSPRARGAMSESGASVAVSGAGSSGGDGGEGDMGVGGSGVSGVAVASSSARVWEAPMAVWSEEEEEDAQFVEEGLGESWRVGGG